MKSSLNVAEVRFVDGRSSQNFYYDDVLGRYLWESVGRPPPRTAWSTGDRFPSSRHRRPRQACDGDAKPSIRAAAAVRPVQPY